MSKGYNDTQVRVWRPGQDTNVNARRACQQFVLHPQLFVKGNNSYSIGLSHPSEPLLFTSRKDMVRSLAGPDQIW